MRLGSLVLGMQAFWRLHNVVQTFDMPSAGDVPTLLVGDYFLVSKYSYGIFGGEPFSGNTGCIPPAK